MRRHGAWPKAGLNLNRALADALLTLMAPHWPHVLREPFFVERRHLIRRGIRKKLLDVERSVPISKRDQVQKRTNAAVKAAGGLLVGVMRRARTSADKIQISVREELETFIKKKLERVYWKALKESGRGCIDRQKVSTYIYIWEF